jgi:hypothetical protein
MMKKRISISILTLLFLVSTTGMPIWSHYCEMMQKRSISECEMCKAEIEKIEPSCCSEKTMEYFITISSPNPACCQDEFIYNKIEDEFLSNKIEAKIFVNSEHSIITNVSLADFTQSQFIQKYLISSSPPKFLTNDIYLNNSVFLI